MEMSRPYKSRLLAPIGGRGVGTFRATARQAPRRPSPLARDERACMGGSSSGGRPQEWAPASGFRFRRLRVNPLYLETGPAGDPSSRAGAFLHRPVNRPGVPLCRFRTEWGAAPNVTHLSPPLSPDPMSGRQIVGVSPQASETALVAG